MASNNIEQGEKQNVQRYEQGHRLLAGCIPYQVKSVGNGTSIEQRIQILMISSLNGQGLVFPKGGWETDETVEDAACREAVEEAGVQGLIKEKLGYWIFTKKRRNTVLNPEGFCKAYMFALEVTQELETWPEQESRRRQWFTITSAIKNVRHEWMKEALKKFQECLENIHVINMQNMNVEQVVQPKELARNTYINLINSCKTLKMTREAHARVAHALHSDVRMSNVLVQAYGRCGQVEEARRVFDLIQSKNAFSWSVMLTAYARHGHLQDAKNIFDWMPGRNMVSWTAMLAAYAQNGHPLEAKRVFDAMPERDLVSWTTMITAYALYGNLEEARLVFETIPEQDLVSWTVMLTTFAEAGDVEDAKSLFDAMKIRNLLSWTSMLLAYAQIGLVKEAEVIFESMPERDIVSWTAMLVAYSQKGLIEEAKQVFDGMHQRDLVSWNAMLSGYAQNGHLHEAKRVFDSMEEWNLDSWNAMLSAYAQNGQLEEAAGMFLTMQETETDLISWNTILTGFAKNARLDEAKSVFDAMRERNLVSWNAMLTAYAQNGCLSMAKKVFDHMEELNTVSWNALLASFAQQGMPEDALELFHCMKLTETPDEIAFICILIACSHLGEVDSGWEYFCSMCVDFNLRPNKQHFCCVIDILGRAGYLRDAEDLIANMPFTPDASDWRSLLGACRSNKDTDCAARTTSHVIVAEPQHSAAYVLRASEIL